MLSLKSKKLSLGVLAILVAIDCYVELQRSTDTSSLADTSIPSQQVPHLPTLSIVPMSPLFMSGKLLDFADSGNRLSTFQELQSLLYITPLQIGLSQLSRYEPAQQPVETPQVYQPTILLESVMTSQIDADAKEVPAEVTQPPHAAQKRAETPQAVNLLKLLALYSMLHR